MIHWARDLHWILMLAPWAVAAGVIIGARKQ